MRNKIVAGNWKMNGQRQQIIQLMHELIELIDRECTTDVMVAPPAIFIPMVHELLEKSRISLGAQNVYPKNFGAFTGEISGEMLREFDCRYVIVGHSERRVYFHEDKHFVAQKFHHVKDHGMIPILCVGESLHDREQGNTEAIIAEQLYAVCEKNNNAFHNSVIAYEPVWAIGTGQSATPEQAQEIHQFIRKLIIDVNGYDGDHTPILYGGSVNEQNAQALFSMPDIDGGLIGGASLNAKQFVDIVQCIN